MWALSFHENSVAGLRLPQSPHFTHALRGWGQTAVYFEVNIGWVANLRQRGEKTPNRGLSRLGVVCGGLAPVRCRFGNFGSLSTQGASVLLDPPVDHVAAAESLSRDAGAGLAPVRVPGPHS